MSDVVPESTRTQQRELTPRQRMFWLEEELHPGVPCNGVVLRLTIEGELDPERFRRAFSEVSRSFDALSMRVLRVGGDLAPDFDEDTAAGLELVDLSTVIDPDLACRTWFQNRCSRQFQPGGCLADAALLRLAPQRWQFFLNQHHSVTDVMSCTLIHRALESAYANSAAAAPARTYADFVDDDATYRAGPSHAADLKFWTEHFAAAPEPPEFYGRAGRFKGPLAERIALRLSEEMSQAVWHRSRESSLAQIFAVTMFAYLRRVTGQSDICIGAPLLNRSAQFAATPGLFMEVCPNRLFVDAGDSFDAIAAKLRAEIATVREHRRHFVPARLSGHEAIVNVLSARPNSFAGMPAEHDITMSLSALEHVVDDGGAADWSGRESLSVWVNNTGPGTPIELSFDLNRGLFDDAALRRRAVRHFVSLLEVFLADPHAVIDDVDILADDERAILLPSESGAYLDGLRPSTVIERFERQADETPTASAIVHGDATTTYADLRDRVRRIDAALRLRGVAPGDLVGVCMRRSVDLVAALLATMRAGAAYVPIDPHHPSDRISLILEDASPRVLLVDGEAANALDARWRERVLPISEAIAATPDDPTPEPRAISTGVAYVIFTSGSTGRPKGVRVLHHGLSTFLAAMTQEPGLARDDRLVAVTTVSFDIAGLELYLPLVNGANVVLADAETAMNAEELARLIDSSNATVFQATPATFRMLLQAGWKGRAGLKVLCGGEALPAELAEALLPRVASLWNVYGPTETTIWSTLHRVRPEDRPIPIGRPIRGTQTFVLGSRGAPAPIGCVGELHIGGDGVAEGYHGRDDLTRERFVANPFSSVRNARMYRTGDLVRVLPDGLLAYVGRADFQVKVRGFRIELGEIESVLTACAEVREAVAVARPDASGELGLVGYFVPSRAGVDVGELREHLRAKLPSYMVPPHLVALDALPLTPNGKIDRKALPAPTGGAAAETSGDYEPPKSDVEVRLAAMWEDLLGRKRVGVSESFFDVGGHSLLAVRLTSRIREELGVPIELVQIFRTPTIRGLADAIGGRALVGGSSVVPLRRGATGAPLICLCGIHLYQRLAQSIGGDRPVLGIYIPEEGEMLDRIARGDGEGPSVEALAASYFRAIQSERGAAPLRLLGFCFGGILAFEVAKLARAAGVEVELLALVDSPLWSRMRRARTKQAATHARRLLRDGPGYLFERLGARHAALGAAPPADAAAVPDDVARLNALARRSRSYVPKGTYGGRVVLVRTDDEGIYGTWSRTRLLGWEGILTGSVETLDVSTQHQDLLTGETAADIGRWLTERA